MPTSMDFGSVPRHQRGKKLKVFPQNGGEKIGSMISSEAIEFWIVEFISDGLTRSECIQFFDREFCRKAIDLSTLEHAKKLINDRFPLEPWEIKLGQLIKISQQRNYKRVWAFFKFIEFYPSPTKAQIKAIVLALGFTPKWVKEVIKSKQNNLTAS